MLGFTLRFTSQAQIEIVRRLLDDQAANLKFSLAAHETGNDDDALAEPEEIKEELRIIEQLLERLPQEG